jgi:hypothetical protein
LRYHRTFGLDAEQLDELEARIEDILPDPWDKGTGRPKSLSLREAIRNYSEVLWCTTRHSRSDLHTYFW